MSILRGLKQTHGLVQQYGKNSLFLKKKTLFNQTSQRLLQVNFSEGVQTVTSTSLSSVLLLR
jgi:hypothetical protein